MAANCKPFVIPEDVQQLIAANVPAAAGIDLSADIGPKVAAEYLQKLQEGRPRCPDDTCRHNVDLAIERLQSVI